MDRKELGDFGEKVAGELLLSKGYRILERNYRCRFGEIDLICGNKGELAFVEVKTRGSLSFGFPAEAVNWGKQQRIRRSAVFYMESHGIERKNFSFQVVELYINHIENAF